MYQQHQHDVSYQQHQHNVSTADSTSFQNQLKVYQERHRQSRKEIFANEYCQVADEILLGARYEEPFDDTRDTDYSDGNDDSVDNNSENERKASIGAWEKHSNGAASKMMKKMNFGGKGLGVRGDGITSPIKILKKEVFNQVSENSGDKSVKCWPSGTVLITGSSMLQGLQEKRLTVNGINVKVRANPGATVRDMKDHLNAYLRKKPTHLILHVGANDSSAKETSSDDIFDGLIDLKSYAENKVPGIKVVFSCPTIRTDDSVASIKLVFLRNRLKRDRQNIISNDNITHEHLGRKGLHLNQKGVGKLAMNLKAYVRGL